MPILFECSSIAHISRHWNASVGSHCLSSQFIEKVPLSSHIAQPWHILQQFCSLKNYLHVWSLAAGKLQELVKRIQLGRQLPLSKSWTLFAHSSYIVQNICRNHSQANVAATFSHSHKNHQSRLGIFTSITIFFLCYNTFKINGMSKIILLSVSSELQFTVFSSVP